MHLRVYNSSQTCETGRQHAAPILLTSLHNCLKHELNYQMKKFTWERSIETKACTREKASDVKDRAWI